MLVSRLWGKEIGDGCGIDAWNLSPRKRWDRSAVVTFIPFGLSDFTPVAALPSAFCIRAGRLGRCPFELPYTPCRIVGGVEQEVRVVYIFACTGREVISVAATPS